MAPSSHHVHSPVQSRSQSPEVAISASTSPTKLAAVSGLIILTCPFLIIWLQQICHQFQVEKNLAQTQAQELRRKLADITNQEDNEGSDPETQLTKRPRTSGNLDDSDTSNEETQVISAGHRFVMLYSPWLRLGEEIFKVEYNPDLDEAECFENNENRVQGQLQEIRKVLGSRLADEMSSEKWIAKAVSYDIIRALQILTVLLVYKRNGNSALQYRYSPSPSMCCTLWGVWVGYASSWFKEGEILGPHWVG